MTSLKICHLHRAMMKLAACTVALVAMAAVAHGYVVLKDKAHIQLNDVNGQKTIGASTYNRLAWDPASNIVYNTGNKFIGSP